MSKKINLGINWREITKQMLKLVIIEVIESPGIKMGKIAKFGSLIL